MTAYQTDLRRRIRAIYDAANPPPVKIQSMSTPTVTIPQ